ncbi:hypothetical protein HU200_038218 [Digitaria exilis]|uniref:Uncharacterized protein n=1 Tax=Digitaria exilis TaxID=1010633 RepID=A0A835BE26_9POAL|nr:hypothetical protein HU200_038218 [Digitaria exilis]
MQSLKGSGEESAPIERHWVLAQFSRCCGEAQPTAPRLSPSLRRLLPSTLAAAAAATCRPLRAPLTTWQIRKSARACRDVGVLDRTAAGHPRGLLRRDEYVIQPSAAVSSLLLPPNRRRLVTPATDDEMIHFWGGMGTDTVKIARTARRMTGRAVGRLIMARRQLDEILAPTLPKPAMGREATELDAEQQQQLLLRRCRRLFTAREWSFRIDRPSKAAAALRADVIDVLPRFLTRYTDDTLVVRIRRTTPNYELIPILFSKEADVFSNDELRVLATLNRGGHRWRGSRIPAAAADGGDPEGGL